MNKFLILLLSSSFLYAQTFYIKPVHFLDHHVLHHQGKFFLYFNEESIENYHIFISRNDSLYPASNPLKIPTSDSVLKIVIQNQNHQTVYSKTFYLNFDLIIQDSAQVYYDYLLHNKPYSIISGYSGIKIYRKVYQTPLPPYLFYKNKNKFLYIEKACSLDFGKVRPNDFIMFHFLSDSFGIPVFNAHYPHLQLEDSLQAMVYLLTKSEFKFLNRVHKKGYLNFVWSGFDEENKMDLKSLYFKRVYEANLYFYENEEGWRTERGMIYIILGKPSAIVRYEQNYEDWFYERTPLNDKPVFFRFKIIQKKGFRDEYLLERKTEYYEIWNDAIDAWRNGLVIKESR